MGFIFYLAYLFNNQRDDIIMIWDIKLKTVLERLKEYQPDKIILFGSYARGETDEYSDLDFMEAVPQLFLAPKNLLLFGFRALSTFLF
jgi:predicted nucleotidyltransferase